MLSVKEGKKPFQVGGGNEKKNKNYQGILVERNKSESIWNNGNLALFWVSRNWAIFYSGKRVGMWLMLERRGENS